MVLAVQLLHQLRALAPDNPVWTIANCGWGDTRHQYGVDLSCQLCRHSLWSESSTIAQLNVDLAGTGGG